jgi:cathepsin L
VVKQATDIANDLAQYTLNEILNFNVFSETFNKTYPSEGAKKHALLNFLFNQRLIDNHNSKFKSGLVTFTLGLSEYSDLSIEEANEKLNRFIRPNTDYFESDDDDDDDEEYDYPTRKKRQADPVNLNYTNEGFVSAVQDQGLCGSCWSFATVASLEAACFKKYGALVKLSEQQLIDCNRDDEHGNYGCDGGEMLTAFGFLQQSKGLALAKNYPYEHDDTLECRKANVAARIKSFRMVKPGNEALLKQKLIKHGPIAIAIDSSNRSFLNYKSGIAY